MIFPKKQTLEYIEHLYADNELTKKNYISFSQPIEGGNVIDDDVARFFKLLLMIKRPHHILEIGTSVGYSTVTMAKIVQQYNGKITTIELDKKTAEIANSNFIKYEVSQNIELVNDYAEKVIPSFKQEFDFIFMDVGDKSLYKELFECCIAKLSPGGVFVAEDSLYGSFSGEHSNDKRFQDLAYTLNEFNKLVAHHPDIESTLLPIGDGVTVAIKKGE